jgi:hypothetical protein
LGYLGVTHRDHDGVLKDSGKAYYWFSLSAKLDVEGAADEARSTSARLSANQIKKIDLDATKFANAYFTEKS